MRLTIFSQHFWPENFRINDVALQLKKKGIKVNVITGKPNYPSGIINKKYKSCFPTTQNFKGIEILRLPIYPRKNASFINLLLNYISFVLSSIFFSFFIKKKFGEVFFVYATSPIFQAIPVIIFGKILKIPVVLWVQDLWPHNLQDTGYVKNRFILKLINFFVNKIYILSDLVLCQSEDFLKEIKKKKHSKVKVFYNPSNYKFSYKLKKKKKFFDIYYTGNLGYGQNFSNIIKIFNDDEILKNNIRLIIYGSGKNFLKLKNKIKYQNLKNVLIYKSVSPIKLNRILRSADCFFLKLNDGVGLSKTIPAKFQTYLSFGKPILSVNNGIVSRYVAKYQIGLCVQNEKMNDIKNKILKLKNLSNSKLKKIAKNCEKLFYQKFEINISCNNLKKKLEELL